MILACVVAICYRTDFLGIDDSRINVILKSGGREYSVGSSAEKKEMRGTVV